MGMGREGKSTCQGQRGAVSMPSHPGHAALRPVSGMPRPMGWTAPVRPRPQDHPTRPGPARQSSMATPGHRNRASSLQSPELTRGITLRGSGRGRPARGVRVGSILA